MVHTNDTLDVAAVQKTLDVIPTIRFKCGWGVYITASS